MNIVVLSELSEKLSFIATPKCHRAINTLLFTTTHISIITYISGGTGEV